MSTNLPTELLRSLITVSDLGGYTKAAKVLNRSQPAISLQMRRLEEIVGKKLIVHDGKQIKFTEAGLKLSTYARQILHLNDDAIEQFRPSNLSGVIRIGLPTDYAVSYLQDVVLQFIKDHGNTQLEIYCDLSTNLLSSLHSDQSHLIVALFSEDESQYLVRAWEERPVWAIAKDINLKRHGPIPIVGHFENCEYRKRMANALKSRERKWRLAYASPDISGVQRAVEAGFGVTALTGATLTPNMRRLTEVDGFPALEKIKIGLFYKLPRLTEAGRALANELITHIDLSTCENFRRAPK
ncbi:MAG: LysR substrate-binding domain-containing protein [Pseudomonadota bacterium]